MCQRCGAQVESTQAGPPAQSASGGPGAAPALYPLGGLATALSILLAVSAAASLGSIGIPVLGALAVLLFLPLIPVFIVWFYRARKNADDRVWRQRRSPGWAIGAWFVPVIFLWFPYQIMADIWRAGLPADQRTRPAWLPITWWACWLLAWVTGFHVQHATTSTLHRTSVGVFLGSTVLSKIFLAVAAVAVILVIRAISTGEVGRDRPSYQPYQAPSG